MKRVAISSGKWSEQIRSKVDAARFDIHFADFRRLLRVSNDRVSLEGFDCIVPLHLADYPFLRSQDNECDRYLIPSAQSVAELDDKLVFARRLCELGFGALSPPIYCGAPSYPYIYKKRKDAWGINSHIIFTRGDKEALESTIEQEDYFQQEYVGGRTEYTTHMLCRDGNVLFDVTLEFEFEQDFFVKGRGAKSRPARICKNPFRELLCEIVTGLGYNGICCFNCKIVNGAPLIFEINPRFGASLVFDINRFLDAYILAVRPRVLPRI